jgi:hypothetical protein
LWNPDAFEERPRTAVRHKPVEKGRVSLFGFRRKKTEELTIYGVGMKVVAGSKPLPEPLIGAYVMAFSVAPEPAEAVVQSVLAIRGMGHECEELQPQGLSMPLSDWGAYVAKAWPDFADLLDALSSRSAYSVCDSA